MRDALKAMERFAAAGDPAAVATVVGTAGSTYRRAGARMVLAGSGATVGAVSGGCLEGDLLAICRESLFRGAARLLLYDTSATEEMPWGLNIGCNGRVEVLLESAFQRDDPVVRQLAVVLAEGHSCTLLTGLGPGELGRRMLLCQDGRRVGSLGSAAWDDAAAAVTSALNGACAAVILSQQGESFRFSPPGEEASPGQLRLFVEPITRAPRLFVFGADHDAVPLVAMAAQVGWAVTVVDHRAALLESSRFPQAVRLVQAIADEAVAASGLAPGDYCLLMTHHYGHDRELLTALAALALAHTGILGPKARTESLLREIRGAGIELPPAVLGAIASPMGLDIGGESPVEIALSAVAELQAVRYARDGGRLRLRRGSMHASEQPATR